MAHRILMTNFVAPVARISFNNKTTQNVQVGGYGVMKRSLSRGSPRLVGHLTTLYASWKKCGTDVPAGIVPKTKTSLVCRAIRHFAVSVFSIRTKKPAACSMRIASGPTPSLIIVVIGSEILWTPRCVPRVLVPSHPKTHRTSSENQI